MSIIEQAARRLEELRRAGVDVPVVPMPPSTPVATVRTLPPADPVPAPVADVDPVPIASRRSREVVIDLARLEREGYLVPSQARSQLAEQMRIIKRPLLANANGDSGQTIVRPNLIQVVSAMPEEGKTFFAINLAMSIAMEVDHHVLLVDADVLRPSVLRRLGVEPAPGLLDVLQSRDSVLSDVLLRTNVEKLSLLPAGAANQKSTELLASAAMSALLDELAAKYSDRIIVFDAPPLIPTTESRVLASHVGQVVMVVEAEKTTHAMVSQAYSAVAQCPVVLSVLNKCQSKGAGDAYGYYYAA
jgi:receptor protein-tyrosine kinase